MKGLLFSAWATTGQSGQKISQHMCIIKSQCDYIDHLNSNYTDHTKKNIEKFANIKIQNSMNLYGKFYDEQAKYMKDWAEVYDALDVTPLKEYDYLYLFGGILFSSTGMWRYGKLNGVFPYSKGQLKFISHGKVFVNVLAILKAHHLYGIPIQEYAFATEELSLRLFHADFRPKEDKYCLYYNHDLPEYNIKEMNSLQYYLKDIGSSERLNHKKYDFTFAYSVVKFITKHRQNYASYVDDVASKFKSVNLFTYNQYTGVDTRIEFDDYNNMISQSRFTAIIPAYDPKSFAIDRFIIAFNYDCLPLIHIDAKVDDVEKSYGIDLSPIRISHPDDVLKYSEERRLELLNYYKPKVMAIRKTLYDLV